MRTIKVTGKGKVSVKPDTISVRIEMNTADDDYETAIRLSSVQKEALNQRIKDAGLKKNDLKTTYFNVDTVYEQYQAKDKSWKRRFAGYRCIHHLKLEFENDNELLGRVIHALAGCPGEPEFFLSYTVKDEDAAKNELLEKAVKDARAKAEIMASAAGVKVLGVQSIDYSWAQMDLSVHAMDMNTMRCMSAETESVDFDIEPEEIKAEDTVTVLFEIGE